MIKKKYIKVKSTGENKFDGKKTMKVEHSLKSTQTTDRIGNIKQKSRMV